MQGADEFSQQGTDACSQQGSLSKGGTRTFTASDLSHSDEDQDNNDDADGDDYSNNDDWESTNVDEELGYGDVQPGFRYSSASRVRVSITNHKLQKHFLVIFFYEITKNHEPIVLCVMCKSQFSLFC